jgi:NitT/TauT family transport system permease protein
MMGLRRVSLYRYLILPASLPALVAGLRQGWAFAWRSLMAGELLVTIANQPSLGVLLSTDQDQSDMQSATAIIIVILILGICVHTLFSLADRSIRRRWGLVGSS